MRRYWIFGAAMLLLGGCGTAGETTTAAAGAPRTTVGSLPPLTTQVTSAAPVVTTAPRVALPPTSSPAAPRPAPATGAPVSLPPGGSGSGVNGPVQLPGQSAAPDAAPATRSVPGAGVPAGHKQCASNLYANETTTCPFAENVRRSVFAAPKCISVCTVSAFSPATRTTIEMYCLHEYPLTICRGGTNAEVVLTQ